MTVLSVIGTIAGALAALAFAVLVAVIAVPLVRLGRLFDETSAVVRRVGEGTGPLLDEATGTVSSVNQQLGKVDEITTHASETTANVSALSGIVAATIGAPLIRVASFSYGVRTALRQSLRRTGAPARGRARKDPGTR